jgi:hypothetical protein
MSPQASLAGVADQIGWYGSSVLTLFYERGVKRIPILIPAAPAISRTSSSVNSIPSNPYPLAPALAQRPHSLSRRRHGGLPESRDGARKPFPKA